MFVQSTFEAVRHRAISVTRWVVEGGPCHPRCSGEGTPLSRELCRVTGTRTPGSLWSAEVGVASAPGERSGEPTVGARGAISGGTWRSIF